MNKISGVMSTVLIYMIDFWAFVPSQALPHLLSSNLQVDRQDLKQRENQFLLDAVQVLKIIWGIATLFKRIALLYLKIPQRKVHRTPTIYAWRIWKRRFLSMLFLFLLSQKGKIDSWWWHILLKTLYGPRRLLFDSILLPSYKKNTTFLLPKLPILKNLSI